MFLFTLFLSRIDNQTLCQNHEHYDHSWQYLVSLAHIQMAIPKLSYLLRKLMGKIVKKNGWFFIRENVVSKNFVKLQHWINFQKIIQCCNFTKFLIFKKLVTLITPRRKPSNLIFIINSSNSNDVHLICWIVQGAI